MFGFVTINGGIKIHREDCPNAPELKKRFGYRIVKARWSGKGASQYAITLRIIGNDDIGIVNNLTNIISRDEKLILRSINIDSHDGLFSGNLTIMIDEQKNERGRNLSHFFSYSAMHFSIASMYFSFCLST